MSELNPTILSEEQMNRIKEIEAMPRTERRRLGNRFKIKIPGSNRPLTY